VKRASTGRAALMSGMLTALVVSIPYVNVINQCCCVLVVLGGIFAAFILRSDSEGAASTGQCGMAGMLGGCFGGLVGAPLTALLSLVAFGRDELERRVAEAIDGVTAAFTAYGLAMPPGSLEAMAAGARATSGLDWNRWTVIVALFNAMAFSFFGLVGGLVGGALLRRRAAPPPPPRSIPVVPTPPLPTPPERPPSYEAASYEPPPEETGRGEIPPDELPLLPDSADGAPGVPPSPGDPGSAGPHPDDGSSRQS